jgi:hypothetical protein
MWDALKSAVSAVITDNDSNEITGPILEALLNSNVIPQLGSAQIAGVAVPTTVPSSLPEKPTFYFAYKLGTYSNFSSITIKESGLYLLFWNFATGVWNVVRLYDSANRLGVSSLNYVASNGTAVGTLQSGYYSLVEAIDAVPSGPPIGMVIPNTITYQNSPMNSTPVLIYIKGLVRVGREYRSLLVQDYYTDSTTYCANLEGDYVLTLPPGATVQATCEALYLNPTITSLGAAFAEKTRFKITFTAAVPAVTVIAVAGTYVKAAGTTVISNAVNATQASNNRAVWGGATASNVRIEGVISVNSNANNQIGAQIRVYSAANVLLETLRPPIITTDGNGRYENLSISDVITSMQNGYYIELWLANLTAVQNVSVAQNSKYNLIA